MTIVLPSALPPTAYAAELAKILPQHAPTLSCWLARAQPVLAAFDPEEAGCTPFEAWQLDQAGFSAQQGLRHGEGLGPLSLADTIRDDQPVWLADFVHLALGTDQATLLPRSTLDVSEDESRALFEALHPVFDGSGFDAELVAPGRLRLTLPPDFAPCTASPEAVAGHPLHAWWQTDAASRPWRRVLNEVQMVWHDHPVNEARQARGHLPVNGLWLYGGARAWPALSGAHQALAQHTVADALVAPARAGDWAAWLHALAHIDATLLKPLATASGAPEETVSLLLTGERRSAHLTLRPRAPWLRWLPQSNKNWKHWWSLPA